MFVSTASKSTVNSGVSRSSMVKWMSFLNRALGLAETGLFVYSSPNWVLLTVAFGFSFGVWDVPDRFEGVFGC